MISERQEKILISLIKSYINEAQPISSKLLKQEYGLDISPATIRNDLKELADRGYVTQPHTSAGRVPTEKGYKYFVQITFSGSISRIPDFVLKEVESAKTQIDRELQMARELTKELENLSSMLSLSHHIEEKPFFDMLRIVGSSKITYKKNIDLMRELLEELEQF